jgi:hypothetical protein
MVFRLARAAPRCLCVLARASRGLLLCAALLAAAEVPVRADCAAVGDTPICHGLRESELIFLADVVGVQDATAAGMRVADVRFRVLERFKGVLTADVTLRFDATQAERFTFVPGQRLLVYASRSQGRWHSGCTRTRAVSEDDPEIDILRGLTTTRPGGPLSGVVMSTTDAEQRLLLGVRVSLLGNGVDQQVTTGPDGVFQFGWVAPGTYSLVVAGPRGAEERRTVVVERRSACVGAGVIQLR